MSVDSFSSWTQLSGGPWSNHHPPPFTALMWVTSLGGLTPDTVSLAQVLLVAVCLASLVLTLRRVLGAGHVVTVVAFLLVALPLLGPFATILWKDVPETALLLLMTSLVLRLPAEGPVPRRLLVALGTVALAVALLRWNGAATDVLVGVGLLLVRAPRPRRACLPVAGVLVAAGLGGFLVLTLIPAVLPVAPVDAVESSAQQLTDLAQFAARDPGGFRPQERQVLERVAPLAQWAWAGQRGCNSVNPTIYWLIHDHGREGVAERNLPDLKRVWLQVSLRHPTALLYAQLCRAALAWRVYDGPKANRMLTVYPIVDGNSFGIHQQAPRWLRDPAVSLAEESNQRWVQNLAWRPAGWLLALLLVGAVAHLRDRQWRLLALVALVPVAVLLSFAVFPAAEDARYTYAAVVLCQLGVAAYLGRLVPWRGRLVPSRRSDDGAGSLR